MAYTHKHKQSGSIEVVILITVVAAIIGLVIWRFAETQKTQIDTQAAVANSEGIAPVSNEVAVDALGVVFTKPQGQGEVTANNPQGGDAPSVTLVSSKLKDAESSCDGENTGAFGTLAVVAAESNGPQPQYTKEVGEVTYGFTTSLTKNCYSDELVTAFRETVPASIVKSLKLLEDEASDEEAAPKEQL